jgi:hypothetical protein
LKIFDSREEAKDFMSPLQGSMASFLFPGLRPGLRYFAPLGRAKGFKFRFTFKRSGKPEAGGSYLKELDP